MNPQWINYNEAHVEFDIDTKRWYLLGSPLKGIVAGDMYTTSMTGKQETNAFEPINFVNGIYNRFAPAVYQRGWDKVFANVYDLNGSSDVPRNAAVKATWSSVYNDVAVPYMPGVGFSIKSLPNDELQSTTSFRLPKADSSYDYYSFDNQTNASDRQSVSIQRGGEIGRLASDDLLSEVGFIQAVLSANDESTGNNNLGNGDKANKLYLLEIGRASCRERVSSPV